MKISETKTVIITPKDLKPLLDAALTGVGGKKVLGICWELPREAAPSRMDEADPNLIGLNLRILVETEIQPAASQAQSA